MSDEVKITPSGAVKCPNHFCDLEGVPFPLPEKGTGRCPVSGAIFEFEAKLDPLVKIVLKDGTITKKPYWDVRGED